MRSALQVGEALLHHPARDSSRAFNVVAGLDAQPQYPTHKPRSRPACKRPACKHGLNGLHRIKAMWMSGYAVLFITMPHSIDG